VRGNRRSWLARTAAVALVLPFIAACGDDSTGPETDLNPAEAQAALEQVIDQYFNDNPGLASLETFGAAIGNALPSLAPATFSLQPESPTLYGLADRLGQSMRAVYARGNSLPMLMANIPTEVLGTTFVYDPGSSQYVASERTGAPTNGVRFILYDGITTLNEVGYFDLIDNSNFGINPATIDVTFRVFITAVSTTTPVVNYVVAGTVSDTGGSLLITGFLSDGSGQLNFTFDVTGTEATGYGAEFALSAGGISVTLDINETTTGSQTLEASITAGSDEIKFIITIAANGDIQGGSGIFFNEGSGDVLVATFSGNILQDNVTLNNAQGNPLTQQELVALANIFAAIEYAVVIMEELFAFGLALVGVAFFF
jgi:hypothetical protein